MVGAIIIFSRGKRGAVFVSCSSLASRLPFSVWSVAASALTRNV
jgi:hypothetical protein